MDTTTLEQLRQRAGQLMPDQPPVQSAHLQHVLAASLGRHPGLRMLLISSSDGRALAFESSHLQADPRRVSAMGNSFLTLGETLARELGLSASSHVTLSTGQGNMVLVRVAGSMPCTLAALADDSMPLAMLLYVARDCAAQVAAAL